jgi:arabinofuranosyltransferase
MRGLRELLRGVDLWIVGVALFLKVAAVWHMRAWEFIADDAYISFRYARNLAEHGALAFNIVEPPELVEGYTNFLWVLVLALGAKIGVAPEALAPWLTHGGALIAMGVICGLVHQLRGGRFAMIDLAPALWLVASPEFVVWGHSGLETSVAAMLALATMAAVAGRRWSFAGVLAGLTGLTRLDALVPVGLFVGTWLVVHGRKDWPGWGRLLQAGALAAGPLIVHALWRHAYYGEWLPNTWFIKQHGAMLRGTWGVWYVEAWARATGAWALVVLAPWVRRRHAVLLVPLVGTVAYAWAIGGDFMAYSRFLMVATALLAGVVGWLLIDAAAWVRARWLARVPVAEVVALAIAGALVWQARVRWAEDRAQATGWLHGKWEGVTAMDRFARERVVVGEWMREHLPEGTWLSVGAAGALPYASRLPVVDVYGLVDPWPRRVAELRPSPRGRPGHQLSAPLAEIRVRDPDLFCHVGHVGKRRPAAASAAGRGLGTGYAWACVEPGPVADAREAGGVLEVGFYCCLRPVGRTVGPFADEAGR